MPSLARIQELDLKRVEQGRENCDTYSVSVEGDGYADPSTPTSQLIKSHCESEVEAPG
jgi:hypothetical protein